MSSTLLTICFQSYFIISHLSSFTVNLFEEFWCPLLHELMKTKRRSLFSYSALSSKSRFINLLVEIWQPCWPDTYCRKYTIHYSAFEITLPVTLTKSLWNWLPNRSTFLLAAKTNFKIGVVHTFCWGLNKSRSS